MQQKKPSNLILEDGEVFKGFAFGYDQAVDGEVVFNTAMVGYPESLTDPSYAGQILCLTYPLVGNYGIPEESIKDGLSSFFESEKIHIRALVISDYSFAYSHWNAVESLDSWLKKHKIPAIYGIDTRELTKVLREKGTMLGKVVPEGRVLDKIKDPNLDNLVDLVSCKEVQIYGKGEKKVVLVDCGVKHNIIRSLIKRGVEVIRVPWNFNFNKLKYDGILISNGPGNPDHCYEAIENIREAFNKENPIFGICMGNQLMAKAGGAQTYKLKYGHRSHNQPVRKFGTDRCYITSQNHGFAVDNSTISNDWEPLFINMNDGTNEGVKHKSKPFFSVQFHPEASSGPTDTDFLFDEFLNLL